jgi:hypothetical protein
MDWNQSRSKRQAVGSDEPDLCVVATKSHSSSKAANYNSTWLQALDSWAREGLTATQFFYYNPDLTMCNVHEMVGFKLKIPHNEYEGCGVCTKKSFELMVIKEELSLSASRSVWRDQFDKIKKQKDTPLEDQIVEQAAWINYQHHCWQVAQAVRRGLILDTEGRASLGTHYSDSLDRHGKQLAKYYCPVHNEIGEMLPLRRRVTYWPECMTCLKQRRDPELDRYNLHMPKTKPSDFTLNGDGKENIHVNTEA